MHINYWSTAKVISYITCYVTSFITQPSPVKGAYKQFQSLYSVTKVTSSAFKSWRKRKHACGGKYLLTLNSKLMLTSKS